MNNLNRKTASSQRQTRIRKKMQAITARPRLSVHRSNKYVYAQIVDKTGNTLFSMSERALDVKETSKLTPMDRAKFFGTVVAKQAQEKKIKEVVFDKGKLAYHGRVKAVAEGAREGGLQF